MSSYDVDLEIYGIIYIYNPVDRKKLGIEGNNNTSVASAGG